jgi:hypothetical protein
MYRFVRTFVLFVLIASLALPPTSFAQNDSQRNDPPKYTWTWNERTQRMETSDRPQDDIDRRAAEAKAGSPRNSKKGGMLRHLVKLNFYYSMEKTKRAYRNLQEIKTHADRKAEAWSNTIPYHITSTFLFLGTLVVIQAAEEAEKQARLTGEPPMSKKELIKMVATMVVNDSSIWAGFFGSFAAEKTLSVPMRQLEQTLANQAVRPALVRLLSNTAWTTVAFFGWPAAQSLIRMACRLDEADLTIPGGATLTDREINQMEASFLTVLNYGTRRIPTSASKEEAGIMQEARGTLKKVLTNMWYILAVNEELRAIWFSATVRSFFTGDMILFTGAMIVGGLIGSAAGTYIQPVTPIPYTTLIVGFLCSVAFAWGASQAPEWMTDGVSNAVWAGRAGWAEKEEWDAIKRLDLGLRMKPFYSIPRLTRDEWIDRALLKLRQGREGQALVLLERMNNIVQRMMILKEDNLIAEYTIEVSQEKIEQLTNESIERKLAPYRPKSVPPVIENKMEHQTGPDWDALQENVRAFAGKKDYPPDPRSKMDLRELQKGLKAVEILRSPTTRLDLKALQRKLQQIHDENEEQLRAYGKEMLPLQEELTRVYAQQIRAFKEWQIFAIKMNVALKTDQSWSRLQKISSELVNMEAMNEVLNEISEYLGWGGVVPKTDDQDARDALEVAITMIPILVFDGASEARLQRLIEKTTSRILKGQAADQNY